MYQKRFTVFNGVVFLFFKTQPCFCWSIGSLYKKVQFIRTNREKLTSNNSITTTNNCFQRYWDQILWNTYERQLSKLFGTFLKTSSLSNFSDQCCFIKGWASFSGWSSSFSSTNRFHFPQTIHLLTGSRKSSSSLETSSFLKAINQSIRFSKEMPLHWSILWNCLISI